MKILLIFNSTKFVLDVTFEIEGKTYEVTFKIGYVNGEVISKRPEYEDLKKIAAESGLSLRKVKEMIK